MAETILGLALLLLTSPIPHCTAQRNTLIIRPSTVVLTRGVNYSTGGQVSITCQPPSHNVQKVLSLSLLVLRSNPVSNSGNISLAAAVRDVYTGEIVIKSTVAGIMANYSASARRLEIGFQGTCGDDGLYFCNSTIVHTSGNVIAHSDAAHTLRIQVTPEQLLVMTTPSGKNWAEGDLMELKCYGPVGTVGPTTAIKFVWEYKNTSQTNWTPFEGDNSWNVTSGVSSKQPCYEERYSILYRHITFEDENRQYWCYLRRNNQTFRELGAIYFVGNVSEKSLPPPRDKFKGIIIISATVVTFFGLFAALVIVMNCRRSRKNKKKQLQIPVTKVLEQSPSRSRSRSSVSSITSGGHTVSSVSQEASSRQSSHSHIS